MALEDAAAIGCLIPLGTRREDIPARLEAYQHLRKSRGEFVNRESLEQAIQPSKRGLYARCKYSFHTISSGRLIKSAAKDMQEFLIGYDAVGTARKYYDDNFAPKRR